MFIALAQVGERIFSLCEIEAENATRALYNLHGMLWAEGVQAEYKRPACTRLEWENIIFSILEIEAGQKFKDSLVTALTFAELKREEYSSFLNMNP